MKENRKCPHCGRDMIFDDIVCPYCGKEVHGGLHAPRGVRILLRVALVVICLVTAGAAVINTMADYLDPYDVISAWKPERLPDIQEDYEADWEEEPEEDYEEDWAIEPEEEPEETSPWELLESVALQYPGLTEFQEGQIESICWDLEYSTYSEPELRQELKDNGCDEEDITMVLAALDLDFREQARLTGESYMEWAEFSRAELIHQLEFDQFTTAEAEYGADMLGIDWREIARQEATRCLEEYAYSESGILTRLENSGYTEDEIAYAMEDLEVDWMEQAHKMALSYLEVDRFSKEEMIGQLEYEGFTHEQAVYGAESCKLR